MRLQYLKNKLIKIATPQFIVNCGVAIEKEKVRKEFFRKRIDGGIAALAAGAAVSSEIIMLL